MKTIIKVAALLSIKNIFERKYDSELTGKHLRQGSTTLQAEADSTNKPSHAKQNVFTLKGSNVKFEMLREMANF